MKWQLSPAIVLALLAVGNCGPIHAQAKKTKKTPSLSNREIVQELGAQTVHGDWEGKTAPHYSTDSLILSGDFLYWRADEDGLEYTMKAAGDFEESGGPLASTTPLTLKHEDLNFKWSPGFRVGLGGEMGNLDHCDFYINYTQLYTKASNSSSGTEVPIWDVLYLGFDGPRANANWRLHYNTLDIEMGKDYFVGTNLSLRPFMGVRGARILQTYDARYKQLPGSAVSQTKFDAKCHFNGIGLLAGVDAMFHFGNHWGLYGELSGAILFGEFNVKQSANGAIDIGSTHSTLPKLINKEKLWRTRATIAAALGFEWETLFNRDRSRFALNLGYEFNLWFQQNQLMRQMTVIIGEGIPLFTTSTLNGNLGLQGLVVRLTFDF